MYNIVKMGEVLRYNVTPEGGHIMAGRSKYRNSWIAEKLDRINLTVPKGKKEIIQTHAEASSESVNGFINRAIDEAMEREKTEQMGAGHVTEGIGGVAADEH